MVQRTDVGRRPAAAIGLEQCPDKEPAAAGWRRCRHWLGKCCPCAGRDGGSSDASGRPEERPAAAKEAVSDQVVISLDLRAGCGEVNKKRHHTQDFECEELIVRRGSPFVLEVGLRHPHDPKAWPLQLEVSTGSNPQPAKGTLVTVPVVEELAPGEWGALVTGNGGDTRRLPLALQVPPDCPVGRYRLTVSVGSCSRMQEAAFYILFNPWCPEDLVHLVAEEERAEYVMNETGRIYYGTGEQIGARTWNYGQFSRGILDASLLILEKSRMPTSHWGNAVSVVRAVSAMVNSVDDDGVLVGCWSGDYCGGTPPTGWVGSVDILLQYLRSGRPVAYGQCWVFSGVTTTVLRCLGIPARSVTNFSSAHDTDVSLTTDVFLDEEMEPLEHLNCDSIWNFHVWNDCWMARPDLPAGHGGWQAVDATPQETSSGMYRCGPASLESIRNGLVYLAYDAPFIFAEVNSDKIFWQRQVDGRFQKVVVMKNVVGQKISTKAVGSDEREDITHLYKHSEGSEEERIAVETACSHGSRAEAYAGCRPASDLELVVRTEGGTVMGQDFALGLALANCSSEPRHLTLYVQAAVVYYTGVCHRVFRKDRRQVQLEPNQVTEVQLEFRQDEYLQHLVDQAAITFTITGRVQETGQALVQQHTFRLRTPDLRITPLGEAVVGHPMKVEVVLTNPLPVSLSEAILRFEGAGLQKPQTFNIGTVPRRGTVTVTETLLPSKPGSRKLVASLVSRQLTQVHGVAEVLVREA